MSTHPDPGTLELNEGRRLRRLFDHLPALVAFWDRDLRNVVANQAYVEWFGISPAQMRGVHIREVLGEEVYAKNLPYIRGALAGEEQLFSRTLVDPTGRVRHSQASYVPEVVDGEVVGFFVLVTDVTPRVEAQRELDAAQELAKVGSWVYYPTTGETTWSREMYRLLGYDPDAEPGADGWVEPDPDALLARVHPEDSLRLTAMRDDITGFEPDDYETAYRLLLPDGSVRHVRSRGRLERDAEGRVVRVTGTTQDESELRRAAADLAEANQRLSEANQTLADMIGMLGHDIRQPLQGVLGYLELALVRLGRSTASADLRDRVRRAERSARRMNELVSDVLMLVNVDTGTLTSRPARLRTSALAEAVLEGLGADVAVEVDLRRDAEVEVDAFQVRQALTNLLSNALRYGRPPVVLALDADDTEARLSVSDRGEGVPEEFVGELFQRFAGPRSGVADPALRHRLRALPRPPVRRRPTAAGSGTPRHRAVAPASRSRSRRAEPPDRGRRRPASSRAHSSTSRCRSGAPRSAKRALRRDVLLLALGRLDPHRLEAEVAQVVGRRPHVEHPDLAGQVEAVRDELRRHERRQPEGVLVEVHAGVQAGRLLERRAVVAAGPQLVERPRRRGEEPVGVEVRAADPVRLDHRVGAVAARGAAASRAGSRPAGAPSPTRAARSTPAAAPAPPWPRAARGSPRPAAAGRRGTPPPRSRAAPARAPRTPSTRRAPPPPRAPRRTRGASAAAARGAGSSR